VYESTGLHPANTIMIFSAIALTCLKSFGFLNYWLFVNFFIHIEY